MLEYIFPVAVVESSLASEAEHLLHPQTLQIGLNEQVTAQFEKGGHVILDFGKEMGGGVRVLSAARKNCRVRIRFGESLTECCSQLGGRQNATNDHGLRDLTVELSMLSDMTFGATGFRFVRLDFLDAARIKCVVAANRILKKKALYSYEGKDACVRRIYEAAKRTVDLCAAGEFVWDGVKRDRLVWIGDIHPEMLALTALYGRVPAIERSLEFVKAQTPLPGWMNNIPMYSLWWVIILADYRERTGATAFAKRQLGYLEGVLGQMDGCIREDGTLAYPSYFVDWPTRGQPDEQQGARAINVIAAKKAAALLKSFGRDATLAEDLLRRLLKVEILPQSSKQVLGLKYFATGLTESDQTKLLAGGARGMSTFMSYYILTAVASFDRAAAIAMMKQYYGAMLDLGATTFWEDFDLRWAENACSIDEFPKEGQTDIHGDFGAYCYKGFRHSLCHGWAAGVIQFIKENCK